MTLQATLAAIANVTLAPAAKPVPPVVWVKQAGPRRFHAAVKVQDEWCKVTAGGRPAAVKRLREELARRGTPLPAEVTVKEVAPEAEVPAPKPAAGPVLIVSPPAPGPALPATKPATVPAPAPKPVPALVGGRVTPLTDRESWSKAAEAAIAMASSLDLPDDPREAVESFRRTVDETLRVAGYVGAYQRLPNGEMWIRLCRNVYDPTSRAPRPGDGDRRVSKDINGMAVDSTGASLQLKDRKKAESSEPKYEYGGPKEAKQAAWKQAAAFSATCRTAGLDKASQTVAYKLGYVEALQAAGAPDHVKFNRDVEAADATVISAVTAAIVAARAAGKL